MAQSLIKHTATVEYVDRDGYLQKSRFAAWSARQATTSAFNFVKHSKAKGDLVAFNIRHHQAENTAALS